jgi:hypothetical protein
MGNAGGLLACGGQYPEGGNTDALHTVKLAVTEIVSVAGLAGYHTSVILDDREYFFDCLGIMTAPPLWSHHAGRETSPLDSNTEVIDFGGAAAGGKALVESLQPFFQKGSYDIFCKNCNSFTDVALYFLTRTRLPGRYSRIERLITSTTPVSTHLLNRIFRAVVQSNTGTACDVDVYVKNPAAEGFSIKDALVALAEDSDSDSEESDASDSGSEDGHRAVCKSRSRNTRMSKPSQWGCSV